MSTMSLTILALLADPMHLNHAEICEQAGIERGTLSAQLRHLARQSLIYRSAGGGWQPTLAGQRIVNNEPEPEPAPEPKTAEKRTPKANSKTHRARTPRLLTCDQVLETLNDAGGKASPSALQAALPSSFSRPTLRLRLNELIEQGLIEATGNTRARVYSLAGTSSAPEAAAPPSKANHSGLGPKYTWTDRILMVLDENPNGLTPAQVAELTGASTSNAGAHLCNLKRDGRVCQPGGRGAPYMLAQLGAE